MQKELESLWQKCVAFHGHGCGGLAVGFRAVLYAWELFGCDSPSEDEKIVCVAETDACGVDAVQAVLGCTFGKGNFIFRDYGKHAYTVFRHSDGSGVRLVYRSPESELSRDEHTRRLLTESDEVLFDVKKPEEAIPQRARIHDSENCSVCGEKVMVTRLETRADGRKVCVPCAAKLRRMAQ